MPRYNLTIVVRADPKQSIRDFQTSVVDAVRSFAPPPTDVRFEPYQRSRDEPPPPLRFPGEDGEQIWQQALVQFSIEATSPIHAHDTGKTYADKIERGVSTFLDGGGFTRKRFSIYRWDATAA